MATYVLVHGAWSGAHTWRKVRPLLREQGHEVFTPSLTGLGERAHLSSPQVSLGTHIQDVVNLVQFEDLDGIVLLGYSYGGMVVTGCLEHIGERVQHLVYLDAFVPEDGQSLYDITGQEASTGLGHEWLVPPPVRTYDDPAEGEWASKRRVSQPAACFTQPVRLPEGLEQYPFTRTYIKAAQPPRGAEGSVTAFWVAAARAEQSAMWRYAEIETNHMIPNNRPEDLSRLLLELGY